LIASIASEPFYIKIPIVFHLLYVIDMAVAGNFTIVVALIEG